MTRSWGFSDESIALPVTTAALVAAGTPAPGVSAQMFQVQVTAAVLLFRTLTYALTIPAGAGCYLFWLRNKSWRKPQADMVTPRTTATSAALT